MYIIFWSLYVFLLFYCNEGWPYLIALFLISASAMWPSIILHVEFIPFLWEYILFKVYILPDICNLFWYCQHVTNIFCQTLTRHNNFGLLLNMWWAVVLNYPFMLPLCIGWLVLVYFLESSCYIMLIP